MAKKSELLKELGWNEELIDHFMVDDTPFLQEEETELKTELYESNSMVFVYNSKVDGICVTS